ncbi:MAG: hypothetical protein AAGK78_02205 [Planctomycetota bacterium]
MPRPIRRQLLLWTAVPILAIYGLVLVLERQHLRGREFENVVALYRAELALHAEQLAAESREARLAAMAAAAGLSSADDNAEAADRVARSVLREVPLAGMVDVVVDDYAVRGVRSGEAVQLQPLPADETPPEGWSSTRVDGGLRHAAFTATAVGDDAVRVTIRVPAENFADRLAEPIVDRSLLMLVDSQARYLWHYNPEVMATDPTMFEFAEQVDRPTVTRVAEAVVRGEAGRERMDVGFITPEPYVSYFQPVQGPDWSLITAVAEAEIYASVRPQLVQSGMVMFGGLALILAAVWVTGGRVARPLEAIAAAAGRLRAGDVYKRQAPPSSPREVCTLDTAASTAVPMPVTKPSPSSVLLTPNRRRSGKYSAAKRCYWSKPAKSSGWSTRTPGSPASHDRAATGKGQVRVGDDFDATLSGDLAEPKRLQPGRSDRPGNSRFLLDAHVLLW